ncbi:MULTISPECIES: RICIN domain-containing protein [Kitasatospora]|uniref:Putative glycoside hydrolase n=1 Tax=Kitasatospora setae (strain ATCC 33774 / DSM 43861 / JCM 3304 / KCC A-0304 / NBRC 14216 / KM-6054) TaxID=452652 RepID=E4N2V0_KITSK|nr:MULTISPECIES: RICIN domain-containing protein [Kitasatospora]BAJ32484.1 putative glycoside hydrolase [Kitasatospora setae KM-6054]
MYRRALGAAAALVLAATGLATVGGTAARAADTTAQVWITTADGASRLAPAASAAFSATAPQAQDIAVGAGDVRQPLVGFGAAFTESSAHLVAGLPAATRSALMNDLFATSGGGIGLNYLRQPLGASDFVAHLPFYSYEDTRGAFSIARDQQEILPAIAQARAVNPNIRIMGTPWSPPAWMKTSNSLNGGSLKPENYGDFADYLVKAVQAYGAAGAPISDLTVANEPKFQTTYPSTGMTAAQQADFVKVLDGRLTAAGLPTELYAYDHNWDDAGFPLAVLSQDASVARLKGAAFHCYGGQPEAEQQVADTGKAVFFTECTGTDAATPAQTFAGTLKWQTENLVIRNLRSGGRTAVLWNIALDANGGPQYGNCSTTCNGVLEIANGTYTKNAEYYVLGHISRFAKPGAHRIGSTSQGSGGLQDVAFLNPDGSRGAVVLNATGSAQHFSISDGGRSLVYDLPAGAVATFTWPGAPTGGGSGGTVDSAAWYALANANSGKCVDATGWGTANGTAVQQWACGTGANQQWQFTPTDSGYYRVTNRNAAAGAQVLDVTAAATADGAKLQTWQWSGGANQQFRPVRQADGTWTLVNRNSGKCLDVTDVSTADGARLQQWACTGGAAQSFRLTPQ